MISTSNDVFQFVEEAGWRRGLGNLLSGELLGWIKSRRWWMHSLIWVVGIDLTLFLQALIVDSSSVDTSRLSLLFYSLVGGSLPAIGAMIIMQGAVAEEKRYGTVAWLLSKPITRTAYVVSKLVSNTTGLLITAVLLPGGVAYLIFGLLTPIGWVQPINYLAGLGVHTVDMFFWLTLTLMTGVFFESIAAVIAIPMVLFISQHILPGLLPSLIYVLPKTLASPISVETPSLVTSVITGTPLFSWMPLISTSALSVLFIIVAIWHFNRQEF
jgi:ABC-2 type transport system permease protein